MNDLGHVLRQAVKNRGLIELVVRESIGGFQAISKFDETRNGPWGVGTDADPILAIEQALESGARELARVRAEFTGKERAESARDCVRNPPKKRQINDDFEDLLG